MDNMEFKDGEVLRSMLKGERYPAVHPRTEKMAELLLQPNIKTELLKLIEYEGLWTHGSYYISSLSSVSSLCGHESEIIKYLKAIEEFWGSLPTGAQDETTVSQLNLRCPSVPQDAKEIEKMFQRDVLFQNIPAHRRSLALTQVLCSNFVFIPTIQSLFDHLKVIGTLMMICISNVGLILILYYAGIRGNAISRIVGSTEDKPIQKTPRFDLQLRKIYTGAEENFRGAYRRLWRYILTFPPLKPWKTATDDDKDVYNLNIILDEAQKLGFSSEPISKPRPEAPYAAAEIALKFYAGTIDFHDSITIINAIANQLRKVDRSSSCPGDL